LLDDVIYYILTIGVRPLPDVTSFKLYVARSVHWHRISYHLTYGVWTHQT